MAKGIVKFNIDKCKGCELCVVVCPKQILKIHDSDVNSMGYHPISVTDMELCIGCASCAVMCPDGVISVYTE
jgi:2-oxoglutarate ferredoxin oxidoreductase subunit delta